MSLADMTIDLKKQIESERFDENFDIDYCFCASSADKGIKNTSFVSIIASKHS